MYDYGIYPRPDEKLFYAQCERLEERVRGFTKKPLLEDVDGTLIQIYVMSTEQSKKPCGARHSGPFMV